MVITFERDPWGWSHPFHRRRVVVRSGDWDDDLLLEPSFRSNRRFEEFFDRSPTTTRSARTTRSFSEGGNKEKFEMKLDVQQFNPRELDVKLVDNNVLVVEGKHEEKKDGCGVVSRHLKRKFELPSDIKTDTIMCDLTPDGVLIISAKRIIPEAEKKEMEAEEKGTRIPILRSGCSKMYSDWKNKGSRD